MGRVYRSTSDGLGEVQPSGKEVLREDLGVWGRTEAGEGRGVRRTGDTGDDRKDKGSNQNRRGDLVLEVLPSPTEGTKSGVWVLRRTVSGPRAPYTGIYL